MTKHLLPEMLRALKSINCGTKFIECKILASGLFLDIYLCNTNKKGIYFYDSIRYQPWCQYFLILYLRAKNI